MRKAIRQRRRSLNKAYAHKASIFVLKYLLKNNILQHKNIAIYSESDGEIPTDKIIHFLLQHGCNVYLPVLNADKLQFAKINKKYTTYVRNRFGIFEPMGTQIVHAKKINIVLTPLVGFDERGNRLGMGGGFYDKTFAFKRRQKYLTFPKMYGLAYDFQQADITPNPWDITLDRVVTQKRNIKC